MGYSYSNSGALVCDGCGVAGGVRKAKCPFGYCPAPAYCAVCRKKNKARLTAEAHYACQKASSSFQARLAEEAALRDAGRFVRRAAMAVDTPTGRAIHVVFVGKSTSVGYYMSDETYARFPLSQNVTVEDFNAVGKLDPAPSDFYSNAT